MKYTVDVTIHLPRERVITLFDDPANLRRWQPTLKSFESISGVPGEVGAKARLHYKAGKREFDLIETVTARELPDRFAGTYDGPGLSCVVDNRFVVVGADETRWDAEVEYCFGSFGMRVMGWLMPGSFRKQTLQYMLQFKEFAESQTEEGMERTIFEPPA